MRIPKHRLAKYENFCRQYPDEVKSHDDPMAALFCCFGTFTEDINDLKEWLKTNRPEILALMISH